METAATKSPLNAGQQAAADGFFQFLLDPANNELVITGPGGTGKTHLLGHLIDEILPQYFNTCKLMGVEPGYDSVVVTSTTNKAAEVLSLACNRPTSTIHSFLNLKVQEDWQTGQYKLTKTNNWTVHERKILFVDECSLVDTPLRTIIQEGTHKCKIVYIGDHCQMAPITEPLSPVFRSNLPYFELVQPMRTGLPELQALNQQLRTTVETGTFQPIQLIPGIIDLLDDAQMEAEVNSHFLNPLNEDRILAYTNQRAIEFNDHVRWLRGLPDEFSVGEHLINNNAMRMRGYMLSVEEEVEILDIKSMVQQQWVDTFQDEDVYLSFREATIKTKLGGVFTGCKLPVDRVHYADMLKWLGKRKAWGRLFSLKGEFLDLRQKDSSTVYKAQGSSLNTVFIDATNISKCHNPMQAARMLYVAGSRARNRVVFHGDLAEKYGGFLLT